VLRLTELTELTFRDGLAAGIRSIVDDGDPVPCTPNGLTLVPVAYAERLGPTATVLSHPLAEAEGLVLVRVVPPPDPPPGRRRLALVSVRLGVTQRMLQVAAHHLAGRSSDGAPLTSRQLVRAAIADVVTTIETCRHGLDVCGPEAATWMTARLDHADRTIVDLFGAAGYLRDHPARCLHVAALLSDAWEG
jgi:hypothetical protein